MPADGRPGMATPNIEDIAMSLLINRMLLTGAGLLGSAALAAAAPYSMGHSAECADGMCETSTHYGHVGQCADGSCETGMHNHAGHNHAEHVFRRDVGPRSVGLSPANRFDHYESRRPNTSAQSRYSECPDCPEGHAHQHAGQEHAHHHADHELSMRQGTMFDNEFINQAGAHYRRAPWNGTREFGAAPNRPGMQDYPRTFPRTPNYSRTPRPNAPLTNELPRTLPARGHNDLLINRPTRW